MSHQITHLTVSQKNDEFTSFCATTLAYNARYILETNATQKQMKSDLHINNWTRNNWDITLQIMQQKRDYFDRENEAK
ncbi:hypothetical protein K5I29_07805 [Flavobacterium agricola]|uniref:Uncharacterized protein n=1 Tax=Flavobacterium agricola TaxID=2870839 RepID=A0ABY6LZW8_9FLAO|nr:hypothetical protein [Flavobacterium agricola]UYW00463.1 hypothetical protein K5I29_07805 [Flavobacterium agricola]